MPHQLRIIQILQPRKNTGPPSDPIEQLLFCRHRQKFSDRCCHRLPVIRQPSLDLLKEIEDMVAFDLAVNTVQTVEKQQQLLDNLQIADAREIPGLNILV